MTLNGLDQCSSDVSVVVPNWNGKHHLESCFSSLDKLAYPGQVEFILVDNGSVDGSVAFMARHFPRVKLIRNTTNQGFAAACNAGAELANSPIVAFLNNDMRVDPSWLSELVKPINAGETNCTASLILSWDGSVVNFAGGGMNFHGIGIERGMNATDIEQYREVSTSLYTS